MADEAVPVHLYAYDLSEGAAKVVSAALFPWRTMIEAIWHTGVVAYGSEYFFGPSGIQRNPVGTGGYGTLIRAVHLGFTTVSKERLEAFLAEIGPRYTASTHDLEEHNGNNFSDEVSRLLVGSGIPQDILRLPEEVRSTIMEAMTLAPIKDPKSMTTSLGAIMSLGEVIRARAVERPKAFGAGIVSQQQQQYEWRHGGTGGAVCRAVLARGLLVCWGHEPSYWRWRQTTEGAVPGAWSLEVAELRNVCWLDVRAQVRGPWTPGRRYTVSWRLAWPDAVYVYGWGRALVTMEVGTSDGQREVREVMLDSPAAVARQPPNGCGCARRRAAGAPGWFEYDVGEFTVTAGQEEVTVSVYMHEHGDHWKSGLVLDALLVRPSESLPPSGSLVALSENRRARDHIYKSSKSLHRCWFSRLHQWSWAAEKEVEVLARSLKLNCSITDMHVALPILLNQAGPGQPWGVDCRHLHHMLSRNSTLKSLTLWSTYGDDAASAEGGEDVDASSAAPTSPQFLSTLAASWTNATLHDFQFICVKDTELWVQMDEVFEMIAHLHALRTITIRQGHKRAAWNPPTSDASLNSSLAICVPWPEHCLGLLRHILTTTSTLTHLSLLLEAPSGVTVVDCLSHNCGTLKTLELSLDVYGRRAIFKLLTPGPPGATTANAITNSLERLNLFDMCPHSSLVECKSCELRRSGSVERVEQEVEEEVKTLAAMIVSNTSLLRLLLYGATYSPKQWATVIFPALAQNNTLENLKVVECTGVDADPDHGVAQAMLSMLQRNTTLQGIELLGTPLQRQGKDAAIQVQLQQNREYRAALAGLPTMSVKSCRLILCGYPLAGKSTVCEAICKSATSINQGSTIHTPSQQGATENAYACEPTQEEVKASRTRGFEVHLLQEESDMRINVWDFAGQQHYYPLHDFVFPSINSSSLFLIVYSPVVHRHDPSNDTGQFQQKDIHDFEMELTYWLKFIASNSGLGPQQSSKPVVLVAITFMDVLSQHNQGVARMRKDQLIEELTDGFVKLKSDFQQYVEMQGEKPLFLDARCATDASRVLLLVKESLSKIVRCLAEVPRVCEKVRLALRCWCLDRPNQPIMTIEEFKEVFKSCRPQHDGNMAPEGDAELLEDQFFAHDNSWQVAALYFADIGEIIYFRNMDFIVVSPHWLGRGVLGEMIDIFTPGCCSSSDTNMLEKLGDKGFLKKDAWEKLLEASLDEVGLQQQQAVNARQFSQLMLNLHLCYESRNKYNVLEGYFVPVLLEIHGSHDGLDDKQRAWLSETKELEKYFFTGLRLQCSNHACTFLTPGFFPRLQVMLYNNYLENGFIGPGKQEPRVEIDVEMFAVTTSGFDILVEYSGSLGFYVDILVKSIRHPLQTMEFVHQHVVTPIRLFCASQEGCMGVDLEEHVLRHECVKHLTIRRHRRDQSVRTRNLMTGVKEAQGDYYIHTWPKVAEDGMPNGCVLETRNEYATTVQGRVIMGSKDDMDWASSDYVQEVLDDCYPATNITFGKRRGVAVLISMEKYKDKPRRGESVDRDKLEKLAASLKLDLVKFVDVSAGKLEDELWNIARTRITEDDECVVCFVSGHGMTFDDGAFYLRDTDDNWISLIRSIVTPFRKCENLKRKPKVFFVTGCRGNGKLGGMSGTVVDSLDQTGMGGQQQSARLLREGAEAHFVWEVADCLIVFSTTPNAPSIRYVEYGSNFVHELVRNINEKRDSRDLLSILTLMTYDVVSLEVDYPDPSSKKAMKLSQCPVLNSSLRKSIYWRSA